MVTSNIKDCNLADESNMGVMESNPNNKSLKNHHIWLFDSKQPPLLQKNAKVMGWKHK